MSGRKASAADIYTNAGPGEVVLLALGSENFWAGLDVGDSAEGRSDLCAR